MDFKTIIFVIIICSLIFIIFRNNIIDNINTMYNEYMYPIKHLKINSDLTNVNNMKDEIDAQIELFLEKENINNKIYYIVSESLSGGKRLRPIITISTYKQLTNNASKEENDAIIKMGIAIEIIHCTSLVIDDIMDKDLERRGQPSIHAKYGETYALLVSLYMLTLAIQFLIQAISECNMDKEQIMMLLTFISTKLRDLTIGQYLDIEFPQNISDISDNFKKAINSKKINDSLIEMIHKKTSSLFEICFVTSWIIANSKRKSISNDELNEVSELARTFGLIYQISDDFEDVQQDLRRNGKNSVMNYVINTPHKAKQDYFEYVSTFETNATKLNMYSTELKEIIAYLNKKVMTYYKHIK